MPFPKKGQSDKCEILQHLDTEKLEMFGYSFAFSAPPLTCLPLFVPTSSMSYPPHQNWDFFEKCSLVRILVARHGFGKYLKNNLD
jgi:hypothetical protein